MSEWKTHYEGQQGKTQWETPDDVAADKDEKPSYSLARDARKDTSPAGALGDLGKQIKSDVSAMHKAKQATTKPVTPGASATSATVPDHPVSEDTPIQ